MSLAVSDLGVRLLVQSLFVAFLVRQMEHNTESNQIHIVDLAYLITVNLVSFAFFFSVTAPCVDRFWPGIKLHLRYQALVSHKCIIAVVILVWVFSALLSLPSFSVPMNVRYLMFTTIWVSCLITTAVLYCKLYSAV